MVYKGLQIADRHPTLTRLVLLAVGAVLTGLTLMFPQIGFIEWITLIPAGLVIMRLADEKIRPWRAYLWGLYFFMCYYLTVFHWFFELYPMEFTGMSHGSAMVVVLAGWLGLSLLQAVSGALIFPIVVWFGRGRAAHRWPFVMPFLVGGLWALMEWGQTFFWFGVPWGRLALGQVNIPIMVRSASLFGSYFVTFMIVSVGMLLALAIVRPPHLKICALCAGGLVVLELLLGIGVTLGYSVQDSSKTMRVAVLQGNISSSDKWNMSVEDIIDEYSDLCIAAAEQGAKLIVWPETALPITLEGNPTRIQRICNLAVSCNADLLVGLFTNDTEGRDQNSLVLFRRDGTISDEIYSKRHLVPFGEYLPMRLVIMTLIPPLAEVAMLENDLVPGADSGLIQVDDVSIGSLICFDSIYEQLTRRSVLDGAQLIVLSTNDSWFGDSAALRMHNSHDQLRAIESGRTVIRAANTGISSVIGPDGTVIDCLDDNVQGIIVCDADIYSGITLYTAIGNVWIYLIIIFILALGVANLNKKNNCLKIV